MDANKDEQLRAIKDLAGKTFNIPSYQRGYRWTKREVEALLKDIWDFAGTMAQERENFYCLQPVVVKKNEQGSYNVIDGQQRLTTIFLILKFLRNSDHYEISYATREGSGEFLRNIDIKVKELESKSNSKLNIDFYHFHQAYKVIEKFFEDKNKNINKEKFESILLNHCNVLYYEVDQNEEEIEVFVRLNMGKIPLTQTENIKAMFLAKKSDVNMDELKERAEFWYESELRARENNDFRFCVLSKVDKNDIINIKNEEKDNAKVLSDDVSRLEPYLKAIVLPKKDNEYYLLDCFYDCYQNNTLCDEWGKLQNAMNNLSGFASRGWDKIDREIFHYLGFLIYFDIVKIDEVYKMWEDTKSKKCFVATLFEKIRGKVLNDINKIEELRYGEDSKKIKQLLLLFNLEYCIEHNEYFAFNKFCLYDWDIEHIYAQNSKSISKEKGNEKEIIAWLKETKQYIKDKSLEHKIEKAIEEKKFENELFESIDEDFKHNNSLHTIGNLALLDSGSNRSIKNIIFSKKRLEIQEIKKKDFVPIATEKVFNKEFSEKSQNPDVFTKEDREDYFKEIKALLGKYTKEKE